MVYLDGDNDLEQDAITNFLQMADVGSTSNVNIVVQMARGGANAVGDSSFGDWTDCRRFYITTNTTPASTPIQDLGQVDMANPNTLINFVQWATMNFPAMNYALVIWNHGGGWEGVCQDDNFGDTTMSMAGLQQALTSIREDLGCNLNILGFDACLMQMTEVAYQIRGTTDIMVGSEEQVPGLGWPYKDILSNLTSNPFVSETTLASNIANLYVKEYQSGGDEPTCNSVTMSAVNVNQLATNVAGATSILAGALINNLGTYYKQIDNAIGETQFYGDPDYRDLYNFCTQIQSQVNVPAVDSAAQSVMNAITSTVIADWYGSGDPGSHGLSIYLTDNPLSSYNSLDFSSATGWYNFLTQLQAEERTPFSLTISVSNSAWGTTTPVPGVYSQWGSDIVSVTAQPYFGYYFSEWNLDGTCYRSSTIQVLMNYSNHTLVCYMVQQTKGGGCPYVYDWNGSAYVKDNNILPASENGNGTVTKDYYLLQQALVPVFSTHQNSVYSLQIGEFENNTDYIDQVQLLAVDHPQGTSIAVTQQGQIIAYRNLTSPISCVDNNGNNELTAIDTMNGNVLDPSTYYEGSKGDWLLVDFGKVTGPYANLILRDDMKCAECIDVQVPNATGGWQTIDVLNPRDYWGMEAVNMTAYLPATGDFIVRLFWTQTHRLDFVGLDTSPPVPVQVSTAAPTLAIHSTLGDVTAKLLYADGNYVELVNGEYITLWFTLPSQAQGTTRSFILYTDGYYT
jgi:hypothetical protein